MLESFRKELRESGYIHRPLPLHEERSLEAELWQKPVAAEKPLWTAGGPYAPRHDGIGGMSLPEAGRDGGPALRVTAPTAHEIHSYDLPEGKRPRYNAQLIFDVSGEDWSEWGRLALWVKPDSPGSRAVHLGIHLENDGVKKVPDRYGREGYHLVNLVNHRWNHVLWEFASLPKDRVTKLYFQMDADGRDTAAGTYFQFDFDGIALQKLDEPEPEHGWACRRGRIAYSMSGYYAQGRKSAVTDTGAQSFALLDESGAVVLEKPVQIAEDARGRFGVLAFTEAEKPGLYRLRCGDVETELFEIGPRVMETAAWKVLNFIFCERCGYPVPGKHGCCHLDVTARHGGTLLPYGGGWHDAGDMSQQTVQTAEVAQALFELAEQVREDPLLYNRLMEEALWGIEHTLKTRLGDGYRASSVGLGQWTDGRIGNGDDVPVRVHKHAYQNFICGAIEARAARALRDYDPDLAWKCLDAAKEDLRWAEARYREKGMEIPVMWEHTMNSGPSQYYAAACWCASAVYELCGEAEFSEIARRYAEKLVACQETGAHGVPMTGFFYRDERHREIVHFTHQSRDHSFVQALEAACRAMPGCPDRPCWEAAMRRHGEYLKALFDRAAPYGMLPAGIYCESELEDRETFPLLHLQVDFDEQRPHYKKQLEAGVPLGNGYCIRMFPVWFSFRGNGAVHLAMGKSASILGRYFGDTALLDIAREQLYWVSGKNPFCQSLIYGEGHRYSQQYAHFPGEMTGEMPVGIETLEDEDVPYWPAGNNATYKEVWLTPAGRWLAILADLYASDT